MKPAAAADRVPVSADTDFEELLPLDGRGGEGRYIPGARPPSGGAADATASPISRHREAIWVYPK